MIPIGKIEYDREVYCVDGFKLPIEKRPVKISQGHHGPWSHCAFKIMYLGREIINDDTWLSLPCNFEDYQKSLEHSLL
jgi:hypothetical protein